MLTSFFLLSLIWSGLAPFLVNCDNQILVLRLLRRHLLTLGLWQGVSLRSCLLKANVGITFVQLGKQLQVLVTKLIRSFSQLGLVGVGRWVKNMCVGLSHDICLVHDRNVAFALFLYHIRSPYVGAILIIYLEFLVSSCFLLFTLELCIVFYSLKIHLAKILNRP